VGFTVVWFVCFVCFCFGSLFGFSCLRVLLLFVVYVVLYVSVITLFGCVVWMGVFMIV